MLLAYDRWANERLLRRSPSSTRPRVPRCDVFTHELDPCDSTALHDA